MNAKGIGPQGLGNKSHNGFWIGSPAKQKKRKHKDATDNYKDATDKFEKFNQATDTVTVRRGPHITAAMEGTNDETYLRFKGKQPIDTKYTQGNDGGIAAYSLRKKITSPAKACWSGYERVPDTKKGAQGSCRKK
jgi:hypothetical protein